jgi:hypothetical protein
VRLVGQGVPHCFSNADAFQIVHRDGDGEYCTKKFFREWRASYQDHPPRRSRIDAKGKIVADA